MILSGCLWLWLFYSDQNLPMYLNKRQFNHVNLVITIYPADPSSTEINTINKSIAIFVPTLFISGAENVLVR